MGIYRVLDGKMNALDLKDISELCLLGILFDDMRTENGIVLAIRNMDLGTWKPVRDVISLSIERLIRASCIEQVNADNEIYFSITGVGIKRFFTLIKRPLPYDMHVRNNSLALKSYFVESVPTGVKKCVVDELVGYYNCQLCALQEGCSVCPMNSQRQEQHERQQAAQIQSELNWLEGLSRSV